MFTARIVDVVDVLEQGDLDRAACEPEPAPDHLGLDRLEERLDGSVEAPILVKWRFGLVLGRKTGCRFRKRYSALDNE